MRSRQKRDAKRMLAERPPAADPVADAVAEVKRNLESVLITKEMTPEQRQAIAAGAARAWYADIPGAATDIAGMLLDYGVEGLKSILPSPELTGYDLEKDLKIDQLQKGLRDPFLGYKHLEEFGEEVGYIPPTTETDLEFNARLAAGFADPMMVGGAMLGGIKRVAPTLKAFGGETASVRESLIKAFQEADPAVQGMQKYFTKEELELMGPQTVRKIQDLIKAEPTIGTTVGDPRILPGGSRFDPKDIAAMAYAGKTKKGWYEHTSVALKTVFDDDVEQFSALLASTSPQISVEGNLENALNIWAGWTKAGRPTDRNSIIRIMGDGVQKTPLENRGVEALEKLAAKLDLDSWGLPSSGTQDELVASIRTFQEASPENADLVRRVSVMDNWIPNTIRSLSGRKGDPIRLSGAKVNSFRQNILGDPTEITQDTWESVAVGITKNVLAGSRRKFTLERTKPSVAGDKKYEITEELEYKSPGYIASSAQHRKAAEILTKSKVVEGKWTGVEVQESVWSFVKAVVEQRGAAGETRTIPKIIKDTEELEKIIANVPDFATLLNSGRYSEILKGAGYGEKLQELRNIPQFGSKGTTGDTGSYGRGAIGRIGRELEEIFRRKGSKKPDDPSSVSLAGLRIIGGPDDASATKAIIKDISERYGTSNNPIDKTAVQIYNLDTLIGNTKIDDYLASKGFNFKYFSFEEDLSKGIKFVIPNLSKEGYHSKTLWIYHPGVEAASFKDLDYTKAWRLTHELGHAVAERFVQAKYGASARDGRLGVGKTNLRGRPPKQTRVELKPLTLMEAQRSVEWEDVAFRAQRQILDDLGVRVSDKEFFQEYNINIKGAVQRVLTGKFDDPIDEGFRPFINKQADLKKILRLLENTEKEIAKAQRRAPTEGIDLKKWKPVDNVDLRGAIDDPVVVPKPKRRIFKKTDKTDADFVFLGGKRTDAQKAQAKSDAQAILAQ